MITRRRLLVAAGTAATAAAVGAVVERGALTRHLREFVSSEPTAPAPGTTAVVTTSGVFTSVARGGRSVRWTVAYPPGHPPGARLPVALILHARGGDASTAFTALHLDRYLGDVANRGVPAFALASVDGGEHSYWHRRSDGDDPQSMLLDELLPRLTRLGLHTSRIGVFGWSMGGYGALLLAETVGRERVAAVAADSPALWRRAGDTAPGAFDDAGDFQRHDVFANRSRLAGVPVRIACGNLDPFYAATRAFVAGVPDLAGTDFGRGGHTPNYWRRTAPAQLTFLGHALAGI